MKRNTKNEPPAGKGGSVWVDLYFYLRTQPAFRRKEEAKAAEEEIPLVHE